MTKKWRNVLIFGILILLGWWLINNYNFNDSEKIEDDFSDINELHFSHVPVTYSYAESCIGPIIPRLEWAFDILENETEQLLSFENINGSADINFVCNSERNMEAVGTLITQFTYGQSLIEKLSGSVIEKTTIEFWSVREDTRPPSCINFPSLELHEIIHSFGFDHVENNRYSLMYLEAWTQCVAKNQTITLHSTGKTFIPEDKIDDEIISCLKYIYSNGEVEGSCEDVNFLEAEYGGCSYGWYPVEGTNYCCPEPNMIINEDGYCA